MPADAIPSPDVTPPRGRALKIIAGLALAGVVVAAIKTLPVDRYLLGLVEWIRSAGALGVGVYVLVYILAAVLFLPGSVLTLGAGFAYGVLQGTAVVWVAANLGAAVAFVLGRTLARDWIASKVARNERFAAIDGAVGARGFRIVLLTRLSPIFPFNLLNYAYGLTRVRFPDYMLGSLIGMLPGTVMYVYIGSLITSVTELASGQASGGAAQQIFYFGGLAVTVAVTIYVTRIARRALAEATAHHAGGAR
jgi:uncharacterized membrane protein YdjX (TVP38/TMEM64 family)